MTDTYRLAQDEIKIFVEYAKENGSGSSNKYYIHFAKLVKENPEAGHQVIIKQLPLLIAKEMPYKAIYQAIKFHIQDASNEIEVTPEEIVEVTPEEIVEVTPEKIVEVTPKEVVKETLVVKEVVKKTTKETTKKTIPNQFKDIIINGVIYNSSHHVHNQCKNTDKKYSRLSDFRKAIMTKLYTYEGHIASGQIILLTYGDGNHTPDILSIFKYTGKRDILLIAKKIQKSIISQIYTEFNQVSWLKQITNLNTQIENHKMTSNFATNDVSYQTQQQKLNEKKILITNNIKQKRAA